MYNLTKDVLKTGKFELTDILKKIDTFWLKGEITDEQKTELYALAQNKAKPENSIDFMKKIEELEKRVQILEAKSSVNEEGTDDETTVEEYPSFVVGKWYYAGDKMTFEGKKYVCIAPEGVVCVWNPNDYPLYWSEVVETTEADAEA